MAIDPAAAVGSDLGTVSCTWTASDVLLHHLAIGAGSRPGDEMSPQALRLTYDDPPPLVLPSFAVVVPTFHVEAPPSVAIPGCSFELSQVVHGSQSVTVHAPIPATGTAEVTTRVVDLWDKGSAAVVWREGEARSPVGDLLWTVRDSMFVRGEGGWGGPRGTSAPSTPPDREPDARLTHHISPQQALLYRLCGDRNPLHADPASARAAGFPRPILHGLCSFGIALERLVSNLLDGDPRNVASYAARFAGVAFPGDTLEVRAWREGATLVAEAVVATGERAGAPVLADVRLATRSAL